MKTILGLLVLSLTTGCLEEEELLLEEETSELFASTLENAPLCDLPNLVAYARPLTLSGGTASGCSRDTRQIEIIVRNTGCATAPATQVRVQSTTGYLYWSIAALAPGQLQRLTSLYNPPTNAEYWRTAKADGGNLVPETNETDNTSGWGCIL